MVSHCNCIIQARCDLRCLAPHSTLLSRNLPPALSQSAAAWCPLVISVTLDWTSPAPTNTTMAEGEINIDNIIQRLLEGENWRIITSSLTRMENLSGSNLKVFSSLCERG